MNSEEESLDLDDEVPLDEENWEDESSLDIPLVLEPEEPLIVRQARSSIEPHELSRRYASGERDFSGVYIYGDVGDLNSRDFSDINLSNSKIGAYLADVNLSGANLTNANMPETILDRANLSNANLSGAILWQSGFIEANLSNANLSEADLGMTAFQRANLSGANLSRARLDAARFNDANLTNADLSHAVLEYTTFTRANLERVEFIRVHFENTIMPDGSICDDRP